MQKFFADVSYFYSVGLLTWVDTASWLILFFLGTWKLSELTNRAVKWTVRKIQ